MHTKIMIAFTASLLRTSSRYFVLYVVIITTLAVTSCGPEGTIAPVEPAVPTLISVDGGGTFNAGTFTFKSNEWNEASAKFVHFRTTKVRFSVPYPTSIELAIDGKPLTKVDRSISSGNYEYQGAIENPGGNPAIWSVGISTPFDIPYCLQPGQAQSYVLSIVNVSGSKRSQPLSITYRQPICYVPPIFTATTHTHTTDGQPTSGGAPGPCPGGGSQREFLFCFRKAGVSPYTAGTTACSSSQAAGLLANSYPGFSRTDGACP